MRRNKKRGFHVEFRELYSYTGLGDVYSSEEIFFFAVWLLLACLAFWHGVWPFLSSTPASIIRVLASTMVSMKGCVSALE